MEESKKGRLLYFGLKNGQVIIALTDKPVEFDSIGFHVVKTTEGEIVTVRDSEIAFTRSKEVDIPSDEELADFLRSLVGQVAKQTSPEIRVNDSNPTGQYL